MHSGLSIISDPQVLRVFFPFRWEGGSLSYVSAPPPRPSPSVLLPMRFLLQPTTPRYWIPAWSPNRPTDTEHHINSRRCGPAVNISGYGMEDGAERRRSDEPWRKGGRSSEVDSLFLRDGSAP
ncbi:hypothetical protein GWI33_020306 [Rhynchophorus ferrugineus]|uniref:Uncharacterized protein n=1 Tax=Rhynchophorus ferrugineus TaxID=354439 RepID=A0A834HR84_RHYFE|nr:hypothetical protein GWI33_020306 [Rhynchophorus ferrugineus]